MNDDADENDHIFQTGRKFKFFLRKMIVRIYIFVFKQIHLRQGFTILATVVVLDFLELFT
jgi:hypothetical protein